MSILHKIVKSFIFLKLKDRNFNLIELYAIIFVSMALFASCSMKNTEKKVNCFYKSSKPLTRWWWFARTIKENDVKANLDWVKANNFGGVEIAFIYPLNRKRFYSEPLDTNYLPRQEWLSPEWSSIVLFTKKYADSIGLSCDFTFGTGWPFGDTYVNREDATQTYNEKNDSLKWTYSVVSWEYPKKGFILNHMDSNAFNRFAKRMGDALGDALKGSRSGLFCDSWEVETNKIWTSGFDIEFQKIYGYDIKPYMDSIYSPANADVRYDYMKLVASYILNQFYKPFAAKCINLGAFSRVQCAGAPVDLISAYASVDVPETEAMLYEPPYSRIVASAASLASKKEVTSETFTCIYGFPKYNKETKKMDYKLRGKEQVADLKLIADALFANGVNQVIWHGMPFNPVGIDTIMFYASVHVGKKGNLSKDIPAFNSYMEKVSSFMKKGRTFSELAIYLPVEDSWMAGKMKNPDPQQPWAWGEYEMRNTIPPAELKGYNPLWISGDFLKNATIKDHKLICGDASFAVLFIDVDYIEIAALKKILEMAKQGLPICLKKDPAQPGKNKSGEYSKLLAELKALKNVSNDLGMIPGLKKLVDGENLTDFWSREDQGDVYIFFSNPLSQNLHLPLSYGQSFTKETVKKEVTINTNGSAQKLMLQFLPYQSLLVKIDKNNHISFIDITYHPTIPKTEIPK